MMIKHHLDGATLISCAAGSQPEAIAAVVSSHLAVCSHCARELSMAHAIGTVVFEGLAPVAMERPVPGLPPVSNSAGAEVLRSVNTQPSPMNTPLDTLDWSPVAPGVSYHVVGLGDQTDARLAFVKVGPGVGIPASLVGNVEAAIVVKGSFTTDMDRYDIGDLIDAEVLTTASAMARDSDESVLLIASDRHVLGLPLSSASHAPHPV